MSLEEVLQEHWPPQRVIATCGECGGEFFDSEKEELAISGVSYLSTFLEVKARRHERKTNHNDLQVGIDKTEPVKEIEATITVNE